MNQSVGIGEHSDIVEAIQKELDTMALASDRIEMLKKHFEPSVNPRELLTEDGQEELDLGDAAGC